MSPIADEELAGGPGGVVGLLRDRHDRVAFSADGLTWQEATLPGAAISVNAVAAFGTGFAAVGVAGTDPVNPAAWWSDDGLHWTATLSGSTRPGEGFDQVQGGAGGLVATSWGDAGLRSFWTSADGRSWSLGSDPTGVSGYGAGWWLEGDSTRLLWSTFTTQPTGYWTSLAGAHWTRVALSGDAWAASAGQSITFLMRDGILFSETSEWWFGSAVN